MSTLLLLLPSPSSCASSYVLCIQGKILFATVAARVGGLTLLCVTCAGAPLLSLAFTLGHSTPAFAVLWSLLRFFQSAGWIGLVQISGAVVPFSSRGRILAILTLSYTVGDVIARNVLGAILTSTNNWRTLLQVHSSCCVD